MEWNNYSYSVVCWYAYAHNGIVLKLLKYPKYILK
jgi:hypothetical protein